MEYQKISNLLESTSNKLSEFRTRNWVEINDELRANYANSDIRFKTRMLKSNLCGYGDSYILGKGTMTITGEGADAAAERADERDKGVTFKNCVPFTKCISRINNTDIDNAHDIDILMPMYNLIEYIDNYLKTSGRLWQYYKDDPNDNLTDIESFKSKVKITGKTPKNGNTKDFEIIVPLKYLSNFWRTLEMPLINCEVNIILTWSNDCVITNSTGEWKFAKPETKLYVPIVTLSTKGNEKLLQQLKSGFIKTISWNKYESSIKAFAQNRYLNYLIDPSFQGVNRLFVLLFENGNGRTSHCTYYLPKVDVDPRAIKQINFTANLDRAENTTIFFIIEDAKETVFEFSQGTVKVL